MYKYLKFRHSKQWKSDLIGCYVMHIYPYDRAWSHKAQAVSCFLTTHGEHHWSLWTTAPTWLWPPLPAGGTATWTLLDDQVEDHLWGLAHTHPFHVVATTPILFSQLLCFQLFHALFPMGPSPPNLNTHHTHNFKCFSSFHFPFSLYFPFLFLTYLTPPHTHITAFYHNHQHQQNLKTFFFF